MNLRPCLTAATFLAAFFPSLLQAARAAADILPPQRRQEIVDTAERLANRPAPAPVPQDTPNPFNPEGYDAPDPATVPAPSSGTAGPAPVARAPGDREILESLALRLTPSGTMTRNGRPLLIIERNRFEVGTKFIVTYNEQDYELELVAIDRTTFTLRYRGEEVTRPIKPVK